MEQWSRYVGAAGIEDMFLGEELEEYLSIRVYYAAAQGYVSTLDKLLSGGANPDWYNPEDGLTPLQIAALKGRAKCVYRLLLAGADIYATGAQGCTALDLFVEHRTLFRVCDKVFWGRNYKRCITYLQKAHADCLRRLHEVADYEGIVVIHPNDELGLACAGAAYHESPRHAQADVPERTLRRTAVFADLSPAVQRPPRPAWPVRPELAVVPSPQPPPLHEGEFRRWQHTRRAVAACSPGGLRPPSPHVRPASTLRDSRSASTTAGPRPHSSNRGLRSRSSSLRHSGAHSPTDATAPRSFSSWRSRGSDSDASGSIGSLTLRDGVLSAPARRPPMRQLPETFVVHPVGVV